MYIHTHIIYTLYMRAHIIHTYIERQLDRSLTVEVLGGGN